MTATAPILYKLMEVVPSITAALNSCSRSSSPARTSPRSYWANDLKRVETGLWDTLNVRPLNCSRNSLSRSDSERLSMRTSGVSCEMHKLGVGVEAGYPQETESECGRIRDRI